ncbi:hypothetical protein J6T66_06320 [bacterium]|nr:hypothetical protein [bacterium]
MITSSVIVCAVATYSFFHPLWWTCAITSAMTLFELGFSEYRKRLKELGRIRKPDKRTWWRYSIGMITYFVAFVANMVINVIEEDLYPKSVSIAMFVVFTIIMYSKERE